MLGRRKQTAPLLQKYVFVENDARFTTEQSVRVNMQIVAENISDINVKIYEVTAEDVDVLSEVIIRVLTEQPLIQPDVILLTNTRFEISGVKVQDADLPQDGDATLVIARKLLSESANMLQQAHRAIMQNGFLLSREDKHFVLEHRCDIDILTTHWTSKETFVLFRQRVNRPSQSLMHLDSGGFKWLPLLQRAVNDGTPTVVSVDKQFTNGILGLVNCLRKEPNGKCISCLFVADPLPQCNASAEQYRQQLKKGLAINVLKDGKWGTYRHLPLEEQQKREAEDCLITSGGDLRSATWVEGESKSTNPQEPDKILIHVYYSSVNFKDVMLASGRLSPEANIRSFQTKTLTWN